MKMTDRQNLEFMNHPKRIEAQTRLNKALKHIREIECLSAQTVLTLMPPAIKELSEAYENLNVVEATLEYEILHG